MSKQTAAPQAGGEPPSRARATNTTPSRGAAAQRQAVAGAPSDGAPTRPDRQLRFATTHWEGRVVHDGGEGTTPKKHLRPKPSYVRPSIKRTGQTVSQVGSLSEGRPEVDQPGSVPEGSRPTTTPIERVSTLKPDDPQPQADRHSPPEEHRWRPEQHPQTPPMFLPPKSRKTKPMAFCFTACCILFWLLVIAVGVAVLVVYLIYRPQPPRMRVTSATLNAGYIDENGGGGMALNSDLTVLAAISNPNTRIDIVLHYMQLDLYFKGSLIGTQAVWPAPLHQGPGGNVLRSVHLVVSEVTMTQEDAMVWQNATAKGRPVVVQLYGRFYTQLNFGRWLPFRYWVFPRCTLVLDPPPGGALRRARC